MKKIITFLILISLGVAGYFYREEITLYSKNLISQFSNEKLLREETKLLRNFPPKEVEIFTVGIDQPELLITKSGTSSSKKVAYVIPQISGKVTSINTKVGDTVQKGQTLITLGDSLSTDMIDTQYSQAQQGIAIASAGKSLLGQSREQTLASLKLATETAKKAYENAINTKNNAETLYEDQKESAELGQESAEKGYKDIKNAYNDASNSLDTLKDQYESLVNSGTATPEALEELEGVIGKTETQLEALKTQKTAAKSALDQLDLGLEQLEDGFNSQQDQLDFAIEAAYSQYKTAVNGIGSAFTATKIQELGVDGQILQANSALDMAAISLDQKNIKSPISGVITQIQAEEGNFAAPGQVLIKVEDTNAISIKTSVNEKEATLIQVGDIVGLEGDLGAFQGEIISISPTLNSITKKIDVEIESSNTTEITPGAIVKINFFPQTQTKIFIPLNSIFLNEDKKFVKEVNEYNKVTFKEVSTGEIVGDYIEIKGGLIGNEKIIQIQTGFIKEGEKVALK